MNYDCKGLCEINSTGGYVCESYCGKNICLSENEIAKRLHKHTLKVSDSKTGAKSLKYKVYDFTKTKFVDVNELNNQ